MTEEFLIWCNKVALDGLRRGVLSYPPMIKEREYRRTKQTPGTCQRCKVDFMKNISSQKYCRECHEILVHERKRMSVARP